MYSRGYKTAVTVPPVAWVTLFLLCAYIILFAHSFWSVRDGQIAHEFTLANYKQLLVSPLYVQVLFRSMKIAGAVTLFALLLDYPVAYYLSFDSRHKNLLFQLVIVPLWVSYLVRAYAWKTILGSDGVLNTSLQFLHVTHEPVSALLYSPFAVVLTLTHIYTPFAFLPIFASLEHIPRNLIEASHDLGATPAKTLWRVILPLSLPGVIAGT